MTAAAFWQVVTIEPTPGPATTAAAPATVTTAACDRPAPSPTVRPDATPADAASDTPADGTTRRPTPTPRHAIDAAPAADTMNVDAALKSKIARSKIAPW